MIVQLEPSDIVSIITDKIKGMYNTPNVSIIDKSLKKLQKLNISIQVIPTASRAVDTSRVLQGEVMEGISNRLSAAEDSTDFTPTFEGNEVL